MHFGSILGPSMGPVHSGSVHLGRFHFRVHPFFSGPQFFPGPSIFSGSHFSGSHFVSLGFESVFKQELVSDKNKIRLSVWTRMFFRQEFKIVLKRANEASKGEQAKQVPLQIQQTHLVTHMWTHSSTLPIVSFLQFRFQAHLG